VSVIPPPPLTEQEWSDTRRGEETKQNKITVKKERSPRSGGGWTRAGVEQGGRAQLRSVTQPNSPQKPRARIGMDWCTQCYIFRRTNEPTGAWPDGVHLGLLPEGGEPASYEAEGKHRNPRSTGQRAGPSSDDAIACKQPETLRIRSRMRRQPTADSHQCAGKLGTHEGGTGGVPRDGVRVALDYLLTGRVSGHGIRTLGQTEIQSAVWSK